MKEGPQEAGVPVLSLLLLPYFFLWICPCILELKDHALTGFPYRQLLEGVGRGVGGRKDRPWQMVVAAISPINYPLAQSLQQALGSEQTEASTQR